jgi:hypothetical protein
VNKKFIGLARHRYPAEAFQPNGFDHSRPLRKPGSLSAKPGKSTRRLEKTSNISPVISVFGRFLYSNFTVFLNPDCLLKKINKICKTAIPTSD